MYSQAIDLYGGRMGNYDTITGYNDFIYVQISPYTATESVIDTLSNVNSILTGASTFDQSCHHYIFAGGNYSGSKSLFVLDTNGTILHESPYIQNIGGFQYDLKNQKLYALYQNTSLNFEFIIFNQDSGNITQVNTLNNVSGYIGGTNTFNSNTSKYIFAGNDSNNTQGLFVINAQNGTIESFGALGVGSLSMLEYDNNSNKLFGLYQSYPSPFYFVEIDTLTANITVIDTLYEITGGISSTSSVYDQATSSYIFTATDSLSAKRLYIINSMTGQIVSKSPIDGSLGEIECDNTKYALNKYHFTNIINRSPLVENFSIYPNPATNYISINIPQKAYIEILNINGQIVKTLQHYGEVILEDITDLKSGVYIVKFKTNNEIVTKKFIKE